MKSKGPLLVVTVEDVTLCTQLFRERLYRKKCTRQSPKVLLVVLSTLFFNSKKNKIIARKPMNVCLRELNYRKVRQEHCIDHILYYLSGLSRANFSDNLSRNSCICMYFHLKVFQISSQILTSSTATTA